MLIKAILKEIKIKNDDTDQNASLRFDVYLKGVDLNELRALSHKELKMELMKK